MRTRQVGGMALVNPLKAWRLKGEVSAGLSATCLFGAVRKHGKIIEKGVFGVAEHNIGTILSPMQESCRDLPLGSRYFGERSI